LGYGGRTEIYIDGFLHAFDPEKDLEEEYDGCEDFMFWHA
jgi:hypothetical protein